MKLTESILKQMEQYPEFYRKVWLRVAEIPKGKVMTYGDVAKSIGCPGAARAVGNALGKNPFAPVIPCHRVICSSGKLGGYSEKGGSKSKVKLLKKEGYLR